MCTIIEAVSDFVKPFGAVWEKRPAGEASGFFCGLLYPVDDGVPQEAGTVGHLFVVVGGKTLVHHIKLGDFLVFDRVVPVPGDSEPPAVEDGNFLALLTFRGQP